MGQIPPAVGELSNQNKLRQFWKADFCLMIPVVTMMLMGIGIVFHALIDLWFTANASASSTSTATTIEAGAALIAGGALLFTLLLSRQSRSTANRAMAIAEETARHLASLSVAMTQLAETQTRTLNTIEATALNDSRGNYVEKIAGIHKKASSIRGVLLRSGPRAIGKQAIDYYLTRHKQYDAGARFNDIDSFLPGALQREVSRLLRNWVEPSSFNENGQRGFAGSPTHPSWVPSYLIERMNNLPLHIEACKRVIDECKGEIDANENASHQKFKNFTAPWCAHQRRSFLEEQRAAIEILELVLATLGLSIDDSATPDWSYSLITETPVESPPSGTVL